jgi:hypothetical protein
MTSLRNLLLLSHEILERAGAPHALIGGFALSALGYPRATNHIDYLVDGDFVTAVEQGFLMAGFAVFSKTRETLQLSGIGPVDLLFARRPATKDMLRRRGAVQIIGIPVLDAADIVGLKIQAYCNNPKRLHGDLADIQKLIELHPQIDRRRIEEYARVFNESARIAALFLAAGRTE